MTVQDRLTSYWAERSRLEKRLLIVLAIVLGLVALQLVWIGPLTTFHADARRDYQHAETRYHQVMADLTNLPGNTVAETHRESATPLRTLVGAMALSEGVAIALMVPGDDGTLSLRLEQAEYPALMRWLVSMDRQHDIEITSAVMDRRSGNRVDASLVLRRRG